MKKVWLKNYEQGVPEEINLDTYESLLDLLDQTFKNFSSKPAFHCMGTTLTYKEIDRLSSHFCAYLQHSLGLKKGDKIALMMPNVLQYPVALFGSLKAGLVVVNTNPLYTARELEYQLTDSGAKAILVLSNFAHTVEAVKDKVDSLEHVIITEMGDLLSFPKSVIVDLVVKHVKKMVPNYSIDHDSFKQALKEGSRKIPMPVLIDKEDTAFLQYTGGTTGVSKGAILTHKNILANILQAKSWLKNGLEGRGDKQEIIITPLPLYHIFSLTANCFIYSSIGGLNVLITNPKDIPGFVKELKKWKMTAFTGLNTLFNALCNNKDFKDVDFSELKITLGGGMAVHKAVSQRWLDITGKPIIEAYGLTETSPAACVNPLSNTEFNGYVGLPLPSTDVSIRDDNFKELAFGEIGEICIKGPQVMKGYYNKEEETSKVLHQGWLKTGDLGVMTEEGYIKIVDRKKDMIIIFGFNVYPNEIEEVVVKHPKVLEAGVVGVPDEVRGETIKLFIVKKDESLTEEEILKHCRENLTAYKVPKQVVFKKELPKSNVGKILRKDLKNL